jgi:zinc transport system substrate-binding protein
MPVRLAALVAGLALMACPVRAEINVVASIKPVHSLAAEILAGIGTPKLLVAGSASLHTYALKPSDARAVNAADVFIRVSEDLEPFTAKLVRSLAKSVKVVTLANAPGIRLLDKRLGATFERQGHGGKKHGHDHDHGDAKGARDGHIWLDPENAKAMARAIALALAERSPADAERIRANAARLEAKLDELNTELARELQPVAGKPFIVFHDAYQYLEARYGLTAAGSITLSPEMQPSAKRIGEVRARIAALGAVCVFAEPQFRSKLLDTVIEGTRAKAAVLDPEGGLTEPGPEHYVTVMRKLAAGFRACLGSSTH